MKSLVIVFFTVLSVSVYSQSIDVSKKAVRSLVERWNQAHNDGDQENFSELYASTVLFYCQELTKDKCINKKKTLFEKYPTFNQRIVSDLILTAYLSGKIKCAFEKQVSFGTQLKTFPSYLIVIKEFDSYRIAGEGDLITDHNLKYRLSLGSTVSIRNIDSDSDEFMTSNSYGSAFRNGFDFVYPRIILLLLAVAFVISRKHWGKRGIGSEEIKSNKFVSNTAEKVPLTTEEMGYLFEKYTIKKFDKKYFKLQEWRSDKAVKLDDGVVIYPKSNVLPDLLYNFVLGGKVNELSIECKYRSKIYKKFFLLDRDQLQRYRQFQKADRPVFISIGIGGVPDKPFELYMIPLNEIKHHELPIKILSKYRISTERMFFYDKEDNSFR
jgi:hypothetical protein